MHVETHGRASVHNNIISIFPFTDFFIPFTVLYFSFLAFSLNLHVTIKDLNRLYFKC
jgi:hypothetical protein